MSVTTDIAQSYLRPADVLDRRIGGAPREDRAFVILLVSCALMFVAQWPYLARLAHEAPETPLDARMGGALMGWLFIAPLLFYLIAAIGRGIAHLMGGRATGYEARMALFWALLAASPLWLLNGLVAGFIGPGPAQNLVGALAVIAFLAIWLRGLFHVERNSGQQS
jgi:hypothetical protein